jgi:cell wall-associated NlpC family hydrolase
MTKQNSQDLSQVNQDLHWAFQYLGRPWVSGAIGPDEFDCWGFFRYIQKNHFELNLPVIEVDATKFKLAIDGFKNNEERTNWVKKSTPSNGDAVLMAHAKYPSHVGIWLDVDGGGVLHCVRGEGVVFSTISSLKNSGWGRVEYYKHVSNT